MNYTEYFLEQVNSHHSQAKLNNKQLTRLINIQLSKFYLIN